MSSQPLEQLSRAELIDGDVITVRRLNPSDADNLVRLYESLTDDECYLRFFTLHPAHLNAWARTLTDHSNGQYAVGAFASDNLLGVANYVVCQAACDAEVAVVVAHDQHLRGIGTVLLHRLGEIAKTNGIRRFVAQVLVQNSDMLQVLSDTGWPCGCRRDGSILYVEVDLTEIQ
jgi:GNAT superfamily N-acetyltransferase